MKLGHQPPRANPSPRAPFHLIQYDRPEYKHGRASLSSNPVGTGWIYDSLVSRNRQANWKQSSQLIGRILLGKLAPGVTAQHVYQACQGVALPNCRENCWDWTGRAIAAIQARRWLAGGRWSGCQGLQARVYAQACAWWEKDRLRITGKPHYWDIYGTESAHCVVM